MFLQAINLSFTISSVVMLIFLNRLGLFDVMILGTSLAGIAVVHLEFLAVARLDVYFLKQDIGSWSFYSC